MTHITCQLIVYQEFDTDIYLTSTRSVAIMGDTIECQVFHFQNWAIHTWCSAFELRLLGFPFLFSGNTQELLPSHGKFEITLFYSEIYVLGD